MEHVLREWNGDVSKMSEVQCEIGQLTACRSILASIPILESLIKLTIHFSPSSADRFSLADKSLRSVCPRRVSENSKKRLVILLGLT